MFFKVPGFARCAFSWRSFCSFSRRPFEAGCVPDVHACVRACVRCCCAENAREGGAAAPDVLQRAGEERGAEAGAQRRGGEAVRVREGVRGRACACAGIVGESCSCVACGMCWLDDELRRVRARGWGRGGTYGGGCPGRCCVLTMTICAHANANAPGARVRRSDDGYVITVLRIEDRDISEGRLDALTGYAVYTVRCCSPINFPALGRRTLLAGARSHGRGLAGPGACGLGAHAPAPSVRAALVSYAANRRCGSPRSCARRSEMRSWTAWSCPWTRRP